MLNTKKRTTSRATYTVAETAAILGISRTAAYDCIQRGEIPARRFGRRVVVPRHELERLLGSYAASVSDADVRE